MTATPDISALAVKPTFIKPWTAPFHVTMDGIKDDKGCWICSSANNKLAHELVELMNHSAGSATALLALQSENTSLRAVIRPFAGAAHCIPSDLPDETLLFAHFPGLFGGQTEIRIGHIRAAARWLEGK